VSGRSRAGRQIDARRGGEGKGRALIVEDRVLSETLVRDRLGGNYPQKQKVIISQPAPQTLYVNPHPKIRVRNAITRIIPKNRKTPM
jgi:hypothetical protein